MHYICIYYKHTYLYSIISDDIHSLYGQVRTLVEVQ